MVSTSSPSELVSLLMCTVTSSSAEDSIFSVVDPAREEPPSWDTRPLNGQAVTVSLEEEPEIQGASESLCLGARHWLKTVNRAAPGFGRLFSQEMLRCCCYPGSSVGSAAGALLGSSTQEGRPA